MPGICENRRGDRRDWSEFPGRCGAAAWAKIRSLTSLEGGNGEDQGQLVNRMEGTEVGSESSSIQSLDFALGAQGKPQEGCEREGNCQGQAPSLVFKSQPVQKKKNFYIRASHPACVRIPALPVSCCVTLGKSPSLTGPCLPICQMGIMVMPTSQTCVRMK